MKKVTLISLILIPVFSLFGQDNTDSLNVKSVNEISYEYMIAPGYSHLWNIRDKMLFGVGTHFGYGRGLIVSGYSDFFLFRVFTRNAFMKYPFKKDKYDIGIYISLSFQNESFTYGFTSTYYINIWKNFKIGIYSLVGLINSENFFFTIMPGISYKFIKIK